ncbi:MAG: ABC transporter permease [Sumerlaeia bacterium]
MLDALTKSRPLLFLLIKRDLQARYAGSAAGVLYHVIQPLVLIVIYIAIFSHLMASKGGAGVSRFDYAIHLTSGIIPWFLFSEVLGRCTTAMADHAEFLKKMAVPEVVVHVAIYLQSLLIHGGSMLALAALLYVAGGPITPVFWLALPIMAALGLVALGVGMVLSVLHLVVKDVGPLVQIGLQFAFWLTPIVYLFSVVESAGLGILPRINPVFPFISLIQRLYGSPSHAFQTDAYPLLIILPLFAMGFGLRFLERHRSEVLDQL